MEVQTQIPVLDLTDNETGCCPRFNPLLWDEKIFDFDQYIFAKASSKSFMHIPLNLGKVMTQSMTEITKAEAASKDGYLILSHDLSNWKTDHYFLVDNEVPTLEMTRIEGRYFAKVFDGAYGDIPKWIKIMASMTASQGHEMKDLMAFYTTCPKCAKHYGHNYIVLFAKI